MQDDEAPLTPTNDPDKEPRQLVAHVWVEGLNDHLAGWDIVSLAIGPEGAAYILAVTAGTSYRDEQPKGPSFARVTTDIPHDFLTLRWDGQDLSTRHIRDQRMNYSHVQPLPGGQRLLVCGRCRRFADDSTDLNAAVFAADGTLTRTFLLGDGIEDVQTTTDGRIWVSYFDEGVFGNFGWDHPVGAPGLIQWDSAGGERYQYRPPDGLGGISDCYALNVASDDEIWCYYYYDFPLVRIVDGDVVGVWHPPFRGSHAFAIHENRALFQGGYDDSETYYHFELSDDGSMRSLGRYRITGAGGEQLTGEAMARAGTFFFLSEGRLYRADVRDLYTQR
jgi:hypothetical protein